MSGFSFNANATEWRPGFVPPAAPVVADDEEEEWERVAALDSPGASGPRDDKEEDEAAEPAEPVAEPDEEPAAEEEEALSAASPAEETAAEVKTAAAAEEEETAGAPAAENARKEEEEALRQEAARFEEERRRRQEALDEEGWGDEDEDEAVAVKAPPAPVVEAQNGTALKPPVRQISPPGATNDDDRRPVQQQQQQPLPRLQPPASRQQRTTNGKQYQKPAWARVNEEDAAQVTLKKATSVLNKLTFEKFERLSEEFVRLDFNSVELVAGAIDLIVEKAQSETHFVELYAELCVKLSATPLAGLGEVEKGKKFRRLLLERCQAEFERAEMSTTLEEELKALSPEEREERITKLRKRYIGHVYFIGSLYKHLLLREDVMHHCVQDLFGDPDDPDDDNLECLAKLLTTIGKQLEEAAFEKKESQRLVKAYFKQLKKLAKSTKLSSRVRFSVRDLCDLRENDWVPRRKVDQAKTIAEIHRDIQREEDIKAGRKPSKQKETTRKADNAVTDDGWETVGGGSSNARRGGPAAASSSNSLSSRAAESSSGGAGGGGGVFGAFASLSSSGGGAKDDKKKKKKATSSSSSSSKKDDAKKKDKKKVSKSTTKSATSSDKNDSDAEPLTSPSELASPRSDLNGSAPVDAEAYKAKAKAAIDEYAALKDVAEVEACLDSELDAMATKASRHLFVQQALENVLNAKQADREALSPLLGLLADKGALDSEAIETGFAAVLEFLPDFVMDISPKAHEWLGDVLIALKPHTDLAFLSTTPQAILDTQDQPLWDAFTAYVKAPN